jgi:hypothetical protein
VAGTAKRKQINLERQPGASIAGCHCHLCSSRSRSHSSG